MTKDEALKMVRKAEETGSLQDLIDAVNACEEALEQLAQGIELEWYNKGWDDALKEKNAYNT